MAVAKNASPLGAPLVGPTPSPSHALELGRLAAHLVRFEALFEAVPLAIAVFDEELRLVRANARYRELTGLDHTHSLARVCYDAFPNALADLTDLIDTAGREGSAPTRKVAFQHQPAPRLVEVTFIPLDQQFGAPGLLFVGNDVTEREQLREDLARSVAQLESIFDVIPDSVRVFDAAGNVMRSNTQAQQDHRAPCPDLSTLWQLDRPRTVEGQQGLFMHEQPTARALKGERVRGETLEVRRGDGATRVIEASANPLRDVTGRVRGAVTVERDVTERVRLAQQLEREVKRANELYARVSTEAERLERMVQERTQELLTLQEARARDRRLAAIGQLAAGVMHDVNNALNPIMAAAYLLEQSAERPEAVRDYAKRIARAAETGAATASRVGRFIRQEPLQSVPTAPVDLTVIADEVVAMTRPLWAERAQGGRVDLDRACACKVLVHGIAGELREALLNLVQNALDAMPGGGRLGIATRVDGETAVIDVRDSGTGMTDEVKERAFEPFFTTKGQRGSGLGLSEVYGVVKRHRGTVELISAPGEGTTVRLRLPLAAEAHAEPAPAPRRVVPRRVLLVEDNDDGREFMLALLALDGHTVEGVCSIADALERLAHPLEGGAYQVLVTDIGLPDGSGWDLVATARERFPALRVGVVTGWEARTGESGAHFVMRKPVRAEELLAAISADD